MIEFGVIVTVALAIYGGLFWVAMRQIKDRAQADLRLKMEQDASAQLKKANSIIATHSDPDDAVNSLRDGTF